MSILELIKDRPDRWTKGTLARTAEGKATCVKDPDACRWCLFGMVMRCYPFGDPMALAIKKLAERVPGGDISKFNDNPKTTFNDVVTLVAEVGL